MTAPPSTPNLPYDRHRYVHVAQSDQVTDLSTGLTMTPAALARRLDGIQPEDWSIQAYLFASDHGIQKVDAYEFFPNQPQIVEQDGVRYLNRWTPRDFQPLEGDVTPFLEHLTYLYDGDEATIKFVLDWMACLVQKPQQKQSSALLLTSEAEGIGKGIKGQMLAQLVGVNNTRYLSPDALSSDFNDWLASASLVIVEEFEDMGNSLSWMVGVRLGGIGGAGVASSNCFPTEFFGLVGPAVLSRSPESKRPQRREPLGPSSGMNYRSGVQRCVLACSGQATRHRPGLRLDRLPAQTRQPGLTGDGFVGGTVVADHAPADAQRLGRATQGQAVAGHPVVEHLVADLTGLFLGPGVHVVRAELLVDPLDAVAPLADVDTGEHSWIKDGGQGRMAAQVILDVDLQHLASAPGSAQPVRCQGLNRLQLREEVIAHARFLCQ